MSTQQTNVVLFTITEPYKSTCPKCRATGYHTISCPTTIQCRECFAIGCHKVSCSKLEKCEGCGIIAGLGMHLKDCPKITKCVSCGTVDNIGHSSLLCSGIFWVNCFLLARGWSCKQKIENVIHC